MMRRVKSIGVDTMDTEAPKEGDFAYVKRPGEEVVEGEVVSSGENYEIRLLHTNETVEVPECDVWTTFDSMRVTG